MFNFVYTFGGWIILGVLVVRSHYKEKQDRAEIAAKSLPYLLEARKYMR